jgi:alanyl-tRNA synthetase
MLRFDFSHFQPMTDEELKRVESMINDKIWRAEPVKKREMSKDAAVAAGAIAFFGEKYGDQVRVVSVGDFSTELCGGTHVDNSAEIHLFKIGNESGIAAGVRRIIAYTSKGAFDFLSARYTDILNIRDQLKVSSIDEITGKIDKILTNERDLKRQVDQFQAKAAGNEVDDLLSKALALSGGGRVVAGLSTPDATGMKKLRDLCDRIKQKAPDAVVILGMKDPEAEKASLVVAIGPQAPKGLSAADILKELAPKIDAKGGGKPDFAQAGGTKPAGLQEMIKEALALVPRKLGQ